MVIGYTVWRRNNKSSLYPATSDTGDFLTVLQSDRTVAAATCVRGRFSRLMIRDGFRGIHSEIAPEIRQSGQQTQLWLACRIGEIELVTGAGSGEVRHTVHSRCSGNLLSNHDVQSLSLPQCATKSWVSNRIQSSSITSTRVPSNAAALSRWPPDAAVPPVTRRQHCRQNRRSKCHGGQIDVLINLADPLKDHRETINAQSSAHQGAIRRTTEKVNSIRAHLRRAVITALCATV